MVMAVLSAIAAAPAHAQYGGAAFGGGTAPSVPATASTVTCRTLCGSFTTARPGSTVRGLALVERSLHSVDDRTGMCEICTDLCCTEYRGSIL